MPTWKDWGVQFDDRRAIYLQIIDRFKRSMAGGELACGERIPSIRDLAGELRVNPNTASRAYQEMERAGLIYSQRGTGYFVTEDEDKIMAIMEDMAKESVERFLEEMRGMGLDDSRILALLTKYIHREEMDHEQSV